MPIFGTVLASDVMDVQACTVDDVSIVGYFNTGAPLNGVTVDTGPGTAQIAFKGMNSECVGEEIDVRAHDGNTMLARAYNLTIPSADFVVTLQQSFSAEDVDKFVILVHDQVVGNAEAGSIASS